MYYYYFHCIAIYYYYYYSEIAAITYYYYYYPIPAFNKALYHRHDVVKTSPPHRQDITITPLRIADICLSHAEGSPTVADSKSTSVTVSRCSSD